MYEQRNKRYNSDMVDDAELLDRCSRLLVTLSTAPAGGAREQIRQYPDNELEKARVSLGISDLNLVEGLVTL